MSFALSTIAIFVALALIFPLLPAARRGWALLVLSVFAVYWLQPSLALRFADFVLPTITLGLTVAIWHTTSGQEKKSFRATWQREDWITLGVIGGVLLGMALMRYLPLAWRLTPSRPPALGWVLLGVGVGGTAVFLAHVAAARLPRRRWMAVVMGLIVLLFVLFKSEPLAALLARWWRLQTGQDAALASALDWQWLGFSYVAFRLLHTLRDHQLGRLPPLNLREFTTYALFFPAFIAGPIDRAERFVVDFRALPEMAAWDASRFAAGGQRIMVGLLKKFVIADSLALGLALTPESAVQATSTGGLWLLLYGYGLRLFFDFSGYTDIAIGIGLLFGITLPENFQTPYLKTNITKFWQSWHITLSDWARFYIFTPLSRALLRRKPRPSPILIVLIAQLATMIMIGLWHGISGSFLVWGIWHGLGLFAHKQWSDRTRKWGRQLAQTTWRRRGWTAVSWFLTFHFVVLGWVWFLMPDLGMAGQTFLRLFGIWGGGG